MRINRHPKQTFGLILCALGFHKMRHVEHDLNHSWFSHSRCLRCSRSHFTNPYP